MSGYFEGLAERARSGDRRAWETLWDHLRPQIYSKLRPLLRDIPGMDAEDVLGWTMGETWRLIQLHDSSRSKVSTFVLSGLKGRLQNLRRDAVAKGRSAFYQAVRPTDDHDPTEIIDEDSLRGHERAELWADIDAALGRLRLKDSHVSVVEAVRRNPYATVAEVSRIAQVRDDEAHRFFRGIGEVLSSSAGAAPVRRKRGRPAELQKVSLL